MIKTCVWYGLPDLIIYCASFSSLKNMLYLYIIIWSDIFLITFFFSKMHGDDVIDKIQKFVNVKVLQAKSQRDDTMKWVLGVFDIDMCKKNILNILKSGIFICQVYMEIS